MTYNNTESSSKQIRNQVRTYIARNFLFSDNFDYGDDASLLNEWIIDSLGVLELILFLEETYGLAVEDNDLTPQNFDSVNNLADYIQRKQKTTASQQ